METIKEMIVKFQVFEKCLFDDLVRLYKTPTHQESSVASFQVERSETANSNFS